MAFQFELMAEFMEEEQNPGMNYTTATMVNFTHFPKSAIHRIADSINNGADQVLRIITSGVDPYTQWATEWSFIDAQSSTTSSSSVSSFDDQGNVGVWAWNTSVSQTLAEEFVAENEHGLEVDKAANEILDEMDEWFKPTAVPLRR